MINYIEKTYKKSKSSFLEEVEKNLVNEKKTFIVTANPETFMKADKIPEFDKILVDEKTSIVADGIGVVKAAKFLGIDIEERITGVDISYELLKYANKYSKSIYLFGASENVIADTVKTIKNLYPKLNILGYSNGYIEDKDLVFSKIKKLSPDIIMVALGVPSQELLIGKHYDDFEKGIFIGVGGTFDVISGHVKRAPKIFQKLNLEWLYRIAGDKKRIKRFYESNVKFIFKIKKISKGIK